MNEEPTPQQLPTTPPLQPQSSSMSDPVVVPNSAPVFTPTPPSSTPPLQPKSHKKLFLIGGIIAALLGIAALLFFIFAYPKLQAESVASSFMTAVKNNDNAKLVNLSGSGSDTITTRVHDGLSGATYKLASIDQQKNGFNVHFDVSGSSILKSVTLAVEKAQVTNVVIESKTVTSAAVTDTSTSPMPATTANVCLTVADLTSLGYTGIDSLTTNQSIGSYYFQPDSAEYASGFIDSTSGMSDLYKKFGTKAFNLSLRGQVNQAASTSGGVEIANNRANKVKTDLIAAGIPASRITIEAPEYSSSSSMSAEIFRTVTLSISTPTDCVATQ